METPKGKINSLTWFASGLAFAFLWGSASTATKISLSAAQPLNIAVVRFGVAAGIMLFWAHVLRRKELPDRSQMGALALYGLLNISIYLGLYVIAMQYLTAGLGALMVTSNPVFISFFSVLFLGKKLGWKVVLAMLLCMTGVTFASWPLLSNAMISMDGLLVGLLSMVSYSVAAIYFTRRNWGGLDLVTINGWQTLIGGLILLPFALLFYQGDKNSYNAAFWGGTLWLAVPVSIVAVNLWMSLLKINEVRAGFWLFLCPIFGYLLASLIWDEPVYLLTVLGMAFVIAGLLVSRRGAKIIE